MLKNMILLCLVVPENDQEMSYRAVAEYAEAKFPENRYKIRNTIVSLQREPRSNGRREKVQARMP